MQSLPHQMVDDCPLISKSFVTPSYNHSITRKEILSNQESLLPRALYTEVIQLIVCKEEHMSG